MFPEGWKKAKVVPLLKKGDAMVPSNFRPVSNLTVASKVLEKVVFVQLVNYLEKNKLIHPNHHGGRQGHNTALVQMMDQWLEEVEKGKLVGVMNDDEESLISV